MSMELWILSDRCLNSVAEWQVAVDAEGFPLQLSTEVSFQTIRGFLPCYLRGELTGFECYHDDAGELIRAHSDVNFGDSWQYALGLRWSGGKKDELRAAWIAALAYVRVTNGVVFDGQEGKVRSILEVHQVAQTEFDAPEIDVASVHDKLLHKLKTALIEFETAPTTDVVSLHDRLLRRLKLGPYRES